MATVSAPVVDGIYAVTGMSPSTSSMCGGTAISITGTFPTNVRVFVWFGTAGIVEANVSAGVVSLVTPAVLQAGTWPVTVGFTTGTAHAIAVPGTFTFTFAHCGSIPMGTVTTPATTPATTNAPPSTAPATTPATTTPATSPTNGAVSATSPTDGLVGTRGTLRLHVIAGGRALARLTIGAWPATGCRLTTCRASSI